MDSMGDHRVGWRGEQLPSGQDLSRLRCSPSGEVSQPCSPGIGTHVVTGVAVDAS
jgi:hypothetical protein